MNVCCRNMVFRNLFGASQPRLHPDIELQPHPVKATSGFPVAAQFIANDPDQSFAIYPASHHLSARNILYLEAELLELQKQQDDFDTIDVRGSLVDPEILQNFKSWKILSTGTEDRQVQRLDLIRRIRATLK
jgi:hypothetical protein